MDKSEILAAITAAAKKYERELAGNTFLYVYGPRNKDFVSFLRKEDSNE